MSMIRSFAAGAAAIALSVSFAAPADAHRMWLHPSATVLSGEDPWLTVDAAISNDLFYFEYRAMPLNGLVITAPDGSALEPQNATTGAYRSTFDVKLAQQGTYKVATIHDALFARYVENGERKRWRGAAQSFASEVPANAEDLQVTQAQRRLEVFTTVGNPTEGVFRPEGKGLELVPVTHPNDLFAGEEAQFKLLIDGAPAADLEVEVVPGGIRYRDRLDDFKATTGADGVFSVTWPAPGMYWINASYTDEKAALPQASRRNAAYTATLEVLPQ